ncbi:Tricyclene synthase, chloroplastic [Apostasia shenzhenica]|uniref:Tricyclene synthase, chloroplastic n=1 Tax=Apostasia shenzhenica TaxID=1088818 RepID=A0A2I0B0V7_9ASPA|nr:Tricyclene synthase, chloroplastic [Apostasia shenzhenica]
MAIPCSHLPKGFINRHGKSHLPLYSSIYSPSSAHGSKKTLLRQHCSPAGAAASSAPLRRTGNFQPSIWDDSYLQSLPINYLEDEHEKKREKLKKEVRLLLQKQKGFVEQLELVDALRQLGVAYHFEQEIKDALNSISSPLALGIKSIENILIDSNNIHGTALLFRLLREYGFDASLLIRL